VFSRDEYWIERDSVEVGDHIGSGAFGEVYEGVYKVNFLNRRNFSGRKVFGEICGLDVPAGLNLKKK
jgi:hypothetical protein